MVRLFGHYISRHFLLLGVVELVLFFLALLAGYFVQYPLEHLQRALLGQHLLVVAAIYAAVMLISMVSMGAYQRGLQDRADLILRTGLAFLFASMASTLAFFVFPELSLGRGVFAFALLFSFVMVLLVREIYIHVAGTEAFKHRLLVLGTGKNARLIYDLENEDVGFSIAKFLHLHDKDDVVPKSRQVELDDSLLALAFKEGIDEIVVAVDDRRRRLPVDDIIDCKMSGIRVYDLLGFLEKETACVYIDLLYPSWILFSGGFNMGVFAKYGKRLLDIVVSALMLICLSPIMLLVAIASLIDSRFRDPVFFNQVRVGQNGKPFNVYKFRSMRTDAEADGIARWATKNDSRVTALGRFMRKTRLDELPQLANVLLGDMSMVGPRPERPEFVDQLSEDIPYYHERHRMKPGVTGWAQLRYPYGATTEDARRKLEYDLYYVKNASLFLDLNVLIQTVEVVLFGKGAQ